MEIRHAAAQDLDTIMEIYADAREFMAATGNPKQWGATGWPPKSLIEKDIENGDSYLCVDGDKILAVFYYKFGKDVDPCYLHIEGGAWLDDSPYGVVHRIAAAKGTKGAGTFCLNWAFEQSGHLRIDTHGDNIVLQNLLKKLGFTYCGVIHVVEDSDPRLAFEKTSPADGIEVMRAEEEWQRAGAYYVRIHGMNRQHGIPLREEFDPHDGSGTRYIVLLSDGYPVATCRFYERDRHTVTLGRVVVLPEYRGKGLGRRAVAEAERWIRELEYKTILIESRVGAVDFYSKLGFTKVSDSVVKSGCFNCVRMRKNL